MIVEWLVQVAAGFAEWVASLFPVLQLDPSFGTLPATLQTVISYGSGAGAFVDWPVVAGLLAIPLGVWALGLTIKGVRTLLAHIPFIGGNS